MENSTQRSMKKEYPWHQKQSESAWLFSPPGATHKETAGWTFGLAWSDPFAAEADYQPDKYFKQPFLTDMNYWGKSAETETPSQTCMTLQRKLEENGS